MGIETKTLGSSTQKSHRMELSSLELSFFRVPSLRTFGVISDIQPFSQLADHHVRLSSESSDCLCMAQNESSTTITCLHEKSLITEWLEQVSH